MQNPELVATDESLAWASAIQFWTHANGCKGSQSVGRALMCVNSPECTASSESSSVYFQFAPYYRLVIGNSLSATLGASNTTQDSRSSCPQMALSEGQVWGDFCRFRTNPVSVNCPFDPSMTRTTSQPSAATASPTTTGLSSPTSTGTPQKSHEMGLVSSLFFYALLAINI